MYVLRRRIPGDLVEAYGKKEVTRSLETRDFAEAKKRCARLLVSQDEEFDRRRAALKCEVPTKEVPLTDISPTLVSLIELDTLRADRDPDDLLFREP